MESMKEIFDKLVGILTAIDGRGALTEEESAEFHYLIDIFWTYYKNNFWEEEE